MLKGILAGGFWGVVLGGVTLTVASLATEQPAGNTPPVTPQVTAPQTTSQTDVTDTSPITDSSVADAGVTGIDQSPTVTAPEIEASPSLADTRPADVPDAPVLDGDLVAPDETVAPVVEAATEQPVLPNPQSIAPQVPVAEEDLTISTAPAALPAPVVVVDVSATPVATVLDIPVPQPAASEVVVIDETPAAPAPTIDIAVPQPRPPVAEAVTGLPTGDSGVKVRRLTETPTEEAAPLAGSTSNDPNAPALVRYGSAFENTDGKALMGVILLDDGRLDGAVAAMSSLPFPVTVAIDPALDDAQDRLAEYRARGIEVGVQSILPEGATPSDVEITLEATFSTLGETVLLLDAGNSGLQNDRTVTAQAMAALAADGRGLVSVSKGLNMALRAAEQAEVPAGLIFRDLDGDGQDARVIRRFLDQAAFRARQETGVMLLGRMRPDTISALVLWGTANRAGQVALAPMSAILTAE